MKIINNFLIFICAIFIFFAMMFSFLPNYTLSTNVLIGCFIIPTAIVISTILIQTKNVIEVDVKKEIKQFWFKVLFIIYILLLIELLFLKNEYRMISNSTKIFSVGNFNNINIIPFSSIIDYINRLNNNTISLKIVIYNIIFNLLIFMPMGFFMLSLFNKKIRSIKHFLIFIIIITLLVEIIQFITFRGVFDIDDIIFNVLGSCLAYLIIRLKLSKYIL